MQDDFPHTGINGYGGSGDEHRITIVPQEQPNGDKYIVDGEPRLGGAVSYAALTADRLGVNVGIVTSAAPDFPYWDRFANVHRKTIDSPYTTELEHHFADGRRRQRLRHVARPIRSEHLTGLRLAEDAAVLYCPVVHEVECPLRRLSPRGLATVAPQGFFRRWDDGGWITADDWDEAESALAEADAVCMSEEDAPVPEELAESFPGRAFVITRGRQGCRVYSCGDVFEFPAVPAREVDATGAGDVFAAAFAVALRRGEALPRAIRFASREAAAAAETVGVEGLQ